MLGCTLGPINSLRKKGLLSEDVERLSTGRAAEAAVPREAAHELNADQTAALGAIRDALHAAEHRTILIHGVTGSGKTEVYIRAIEEVVRFGRQAIRAGAGNQPDAANGGPVSCAVRPRGRAAQPSERRRAARALAADRRGRGAGGRRRPQRDFRPDAAPGPDRARRRARIDVQAGVGPALPRARRGPAAGGGPERAAGAGQRHAVAGELAPGGHGRIPAGRDAAPGAQSAAAGGADDRPARRSPQPLLAWRDQPAAAPGDGSGTARRRAGDPAVEPPRLLDAHPMSRLRVRRRSVPHCDSAADVPPAPRAQAICHYCDYQTPRRRPLAPTARSPGLRFSGLGTQKLEAEVRARFPNHACLRMDTDSMQQPRQPRAGARRVSRRARCGFCWARR